MHAVIAEHEAILDAIAAHDRDAAARGIAAHLETLKSGMVEARRTHPQYFIDCFPAGDDDSAAAA
jgi:DNA-binding GntR family transcriptional regulator